MKAWSLLVILLAGCATPGGDMQAARDSWQGSLYDEVVSRWGAPQRRAALADGGHVDTWESEGTVFSGRVEPARCERTLIFRNGRVAEQTWQGHPEFCSRFKRPG